MLRVAIIGCGNIFTMHATSIVYQKNAKLVCVCDVKPERANAQAKKYNCKAYFDYKEMLEKEKIDVVHICVPHYLHSIITNYALTKKINVLCEKPMSIKYKDAVTNVELAEKNHVKYGVIFQCRYNDSSKLVKENILNGKLGKVISARVVLTWNKPDSYYLLSDWKGTWQKEGGGVVIDQAIHSLDLANWFIDDEIKTVQASLHNRNHNIMEVDDSAEGFITYKSGATLSFWAMNNYGCDEPIEIRLLCENGKAVMNYDKAEIFFNNGETITTTQNIDLTINYENGKDYWGFQHIKQIKDFYSSIENNVKPFISGEEALKIQKIICEIYKDGNFTAKN